MSGLEKQRLVQSIISSSVIGAVYVCLAYAIKIALHGSWKTFAIALGVITCVRYAYSAVECVAAIIAWRMYGRRVTNERFANWFKETQMPKRVFRGDEITSYFHRIKDAPSSNYYVKCEVAESQKKAAAQFEHELDSVREMFGMLAEVRTFRAANDALNIHSPPEDSPPYLEPFLLWALRNNRFSSAELEIMPRMNRAIAARMLESRPYGSYQELYDFFRQVGGLNNDDAALLLAELCQRAGKKREIAANCL